MQIQSVEAIPNFLVQNKSHDVVLPFLWQYSMNLSYPSASLESKEPASLKRLNLANITIVPAARSWPNPKWNTCIVSGSILHAHCKPGIWHKGTGPGLKADAQAAAPMVPRHLAVESITCQSCAHRLAGLKWYFILAGWRFRCSLNMYFWPVLPKAHMADAGTVVPHTQTKRLHAGKVTQMKY